MVMLEGQRLIDQALLASGFWSEFDAQQTAKCILQALSALAEASGQ